MSSFIRIKNTILPVERIKSIHLTNYDREIRVNYIEGGYSIFYFESKQDSMTELERILRKLNDQ